MNDEQTDKVLIGHMFRDVQTLACPLCTETFDVPSINMGAAEWVGQALGMSGHALATVHADQIVKRILSEVRTHLRTHSVDEWVSALYAARGW